MPSSLIVVAGPPLPGRWALARAVARRLDAHLFGSEADPPRTLEPDECAVVHGDLHAAEQRAQVLAAVADERVLVDWICSETEAHREIFHRWASRPRTLAERELERYVAWAARAAPIHEEEAEVVVRVGALAPLSDQVLRVMEALRPRPDRLAPPLRRTSVLVVEDDPDQRVLLGEVLGELGCTVELAPDAGVALALLESDDIDLIISDERMPGMSGVELAAEVSRRHPDVRSVLLTAHADPPTVERALGAHARNVLAKPVSLVDLQRVLDDVA